MMLSYRKLILLNYFYRNVIDVFIPRSSTDTVPLSSLCIQPGRAAWVLYVDATCINYDGNVFDAALLAMTAALKNSTSLAGS